MPPTNWTQFVPIDFGDFDLKNFSHSMKTNIFHFIAKLYDYNDLSRSRVQDIITETRKLFKASCIHMLFSSLIHKLKTLKDTDESMLNFIISFNAVLNTFDLFPTEHMQIEAFTRMGTYIPPKTLEVGQREDFRFKGNRQELKNIPVTIEMIPLTLVLTKTMKKFNLLKHIRDFQEVISESHGILMNLVQGSLWREISAKFENKFVLPLEVSFDEYEPNNPLGSHRGVTKIGAVYARISCLPEFMQSKLENTYVLALFSCLDVKSLGFETILKDVIDELKDLQSKGILVNLIGNEEKVYFTVVTVLGDNLGVHSINGFVESFQANFPCRFCYTQRKDLNLINNEEFCPMRTEESYEEDLTTNNVSSTGNKESCCFHDLQDFHVTRNLGVDTMHDIFGGVAQYDLALILNHFINSRKYFSFEQMNNRIRAFSYAYNEKENKPGEIVFSHLNDKKIIMSAAEMSCFIKNIHLILGDLVEIDDEHWELVILLKQIVDMVTAKYCHINSADYLDVLIEEYLELHSTLFPNCKKLKHHLWVHYKRIMKTLGPLCHINSMTSERKHRESKIYERVAISRVNTAHTAAVKQQLKLNYRLLCGDVSNQLSMEYTLHENVILRSHECFLSLIPLLSSEPENYRVINHIEYMGNTVKDGLVLVLPAENGPQFYYVKIILKDDNDQIFIYVNQLKGFYDRHYQAFELLYQCKDYETIKASDLEMYTIT